MINKLNINYMRTKIFLILIPAIIGLIIVLALLVLYNSIIGNVLIIRPADIKFFTLFLPITLICAFIVQHYLVIKVWQLFKSDRKFIGMTLFQFVCLLSISFGLISGFVFWEKDAGVFELLLNIVIGSVVFEIYWISNLVILNQLDKNRK
jgi:hypothetical protein